MVKKMAENRKGMLPKDRDCIESIINFKFGTMEH